MKKLIMAAVLVAAAVGGAKASNYPGDYGYQNVQVVAKGPAVVATVSSGIMMSKLIIGYKGTGILGAYDKVYAVVKVTYYSGDGGERISERTVEIQKEWHGAGFLTPGMIHQDYITVVDGAGFRAVKSISLAFFAGSQWDSHYGDNYTVTSEELRNSQVKYVSTSVNPDINVDCWDFIVGQLRK